MPNYKANIEQTYTITGTSDRSSYKESSTKTGEFGIKTSMVSIHGSGHGNTELMFNSSEDFGEEHAECSAQARSEMSFLMEGELRENQKVHLRFLSYNPPNPTYQEFCSVNGEPMMLPLSEFNVDFQEVLIPGADPSLDIELKEGFVYEERTPYHSVNEYWTINGEVYTKITILTCTNEEQASAAQVGAKVLELIAYAKTQQLSETAKRFGHWLEGSGTPLPLDVAWVRSIKAVQWAEQDNEQRFERNSKNEGNKNSLYAVAKGLQDGQEFSFSDSWDSKIGYDELITVDIDFFASVGKTQLHSTGDFTVGRRGDRYYATGTLTHGISDRYDFNPGERFFFPLFPFSITADELNGLEYCGSACAFQQEAIWNKSLSFEGTLDDFAVQSNFIWSGPK